jgi:predicted  nucleic acid-binding Zn-ribbon protein
MIKKEIPVKERLRLIHELQLVDSQLDEIRVLKGELPMEVSDLEDEIEGIATRVNKLDSNIKESESEISRHNGNIKDSEGLIQKYTRQLDDVKNNREYDALSKEIEMQKLEIQLSEKKIREAKEAIISKEELLATAQQKLDEKQKNLDQKKVELDKIIAKTEKDEEKLVKISDKARKKIDERLLAAYDKIRTNYRNGLAVVTVDRDACGGCYNQIPPQKQLEISLCKKVIACEHCGRVLVDAEIINTAETVEEAEA